MYDVYFISGCQRGLVETKDKVVLWYDPSYKQLGDKDETKIVGMQYGKMYSLLVFINISKLYFWCAKHFDIYCVPYYPYKSLVRPIESFWKNDICIHIFDQYNVFFRILSEIVFRLRYTIAKTCRLTDIYINKVS
jgi:hypothetical protein